jgi:putative molybdopterin biosynthesis protein
MASDISYTTEEIAKLLKISKLTVYDLIKKGELPSYRVGKQMRVDAADLEAYKLRSKGVAAAPLQEQPTAVPQHAGRVRASAAETTRYRPAAQPHGERQLVITGQDISLDILAKHIEKNTAGTRPLRAYVGSLDSLVSMYRGESDIVSTHLLDGDSGEYNIPYIRKLLVGQPYVVVNLLSRQAGFFVRKGNPLGIREWTDLKKPGLRIVNRERGSGARVLLDEQMRLMNLHPGELSGYENEEDNHLAVAGKVAAGEADVGIGIEKAANIVGNVDFVPMIRERYDLVMLKRRENLQWIGDVLRILKSEPFQSELRMIHGYDLSLTGQVLHET